MLAISDIQNYLTQLATNGVQLTIDELVRYQNTAAQFRLSPNQRSKNMLSGGERSTFKGRGMEFDEARIYQAGDDIRSIDWRVTARTGKPHTKIFREERERPVFVFVDQSDSMQFGTQLLYKSVQAAHLACLIAWAAVSRGDKLGAVLFNDEQDIECKPRAQSKAVLFMINQLIELEKLKQTPKAENSLKALDRLLHLAKPGSLVHLISDFRYFSEVHFERLGTLARHCELSATVIYDPFELSLPQSSNRQNLQVTDGKRAQSIVIGDKSASDAYATEQNKRLSRLKNAFAELKTDLRLVSAGLPIESQLTYSKQGFTAGALQ
ncbi:DUF58 domain-containing protein [Agaribacter flavus]|uniref:DUF58 domain-containing protein n=1 Tax=Agaribacter flavus TaxID=1902781 RepID=A0ABV7FT81_9ALTE